MFLNQRNIKVYKGPAQDENSINVYTAYENNILMKNDKRITR